MGKNNGSYYRYLMNTDIKTILLTVSRVTATRDYKGEPKWGA